MASLIAEAAFISYIPKKIKSLRDSTAKGNLWQKKLKPKRVLLLKIKNSIKTSFSNHAANKWTV